MGWRFDEFLTSVNDPSVSDLDVGLRYWDLIDEVRFDNQGGYSSAIKVARGLVLVASVDHDEAPTLEIYKEESIAKLGLAIRKAIADGEEEDQISELFWDCLKTAQWKGDEVPK